MFETEQEAKNAAIGLLARREHSRKELATKLAKRCEQLDINEILDELEKLGYLSDQRFTESFIRMRCSQGHGEIRIRFDLKQKGISSDLISAMLERCDIDWFEQASELYQRKYRTLLDGKDYKERGKRMRYMSQRGFTMDQINYSIEQADSADS